MLFVLCQVCPLLKKEAASLNLKRLSVESRKLMVAWKRASFSLLGVSEGISEQMYEDRESVELLLNLEAFSSCCLFWRWLLVWCASMRMMDMELGWSSSLLKLQLSNFNHKLCVTLAIIYPFTLQNKGGSWLNLASVFFCLLSRQLAWFPFVRS